MPTQRSLRIVIAEDEFLLAEDLRQLVEASGHEVVGVVATAPERRIGDPTWRWSISSSPAAATALTPPWSSKRSMGFLPSL